MNTNAKGGCKGKQTAKMEGFDCGICGFRKVDAKEEGGAKANMHAYIDKHTSFYGQYCTMDVDAGTDMDARPDRVMRFKDNKALSPAGVNAIINSAAHAALLKAISHKTADGISFFVRTKDDAAMMAKMRGKKTQAALKTALRAMMAAPEDLDAQALLKFADKTFVPYFDDNFAHSQLAIDLGLAKDGDQTLFALFPRGSGLACVIGKANMRDVMFYLGQTASYAHLCCGMCGIVTDGRLKCSVCRATVYCGKECQSDDWPCHKLVCRRRPLGRAVDCD